MEHRPSPKALAALGALVALSVTAFAMPPRRPPEYTPTVDVKTVTHRAVRPAMLLIGDSYAGGATGVNAAGTFPWHACATLSWVCHVDGQGGTGYRADGHADSPSFRPYDDRVAADQARYAAEVVVVTGGREDGTASGEYAAARKLFTHLMVAYPAAMHVVVEPFWVDDSPPPSMVALRTSIKKAAQETGFRWIDSDGWLGSSLISDDGVHPTLKGHQVIGERLAAALQRLPVPAPAMEQSA